MNIQLTSNQITRFVLRIANYLRFSSPDPTPLDQIKLQRKTLSEKLTLTDDDRTLIARWDELIKQLEK